MLEYFQSEMIYTYSVFPYESGLDSNGNPLEGYSDTATVTDKQCAFYEGSAAERWVSDRYKTVVTGVIISDVDVSVPDGAKIILSNGKEYICVHAEDPLGIGDVLVIAVKNPDDGVSVDG